MSRNKTLAKQVMKRDYGICCCCGFAASEVHHIIPLCKGGTDTLDNMVALCSFDHLHAPDTKEEFEEYKRTGGTKLNCIMGRSITYYFRHKDEMEELDLQKVVEVTQSLINTLRETDINYCIEKYGAKE